MIRLFCNHNWEVLLDELMKSPFSKSGMAMESCLESKGSSISAWYFREKLVVVLACKKCGKQKTIVEENPEIHLMEPAVL